MIIKAEHNLLGAFICWFELWKMKKKFHAFRIEGEVTDKNLPILVICNHISWWDGIWVLNVNRTMFRRKFHFMMLEEMLRKNRVLQFTGGYSIQKNSRTVIETINYTTELLSNPENLVLMFPQGEINSIYNDAIIFEKGIEKILRQCKTKVQVLFIANFLEYLSNPKPSVFCYIQDYSGDWGAEKLHAGYENFYLDCLENQKKLRS